MSNLASIPEDVRRLRETVEALPTTRWTKTRATVEVQETDEFASALIPIRGLDKSYSRNLAAHIAAANPATVGVLLGCVDALHDIVEDLEQHVVGAGDWRTDALAISRVYVRAKAALSNVGEEAS